MRTVVTHRQTGELKLRYSPIQPSADDGSTSIQSGAISEADMKRTVIIQVPVEVSDEAGLTRCLPLVARQAAEAVSMVHGARAYGKPCAEIANLGFGDEETRVISGNLFCQCGGIPQTDKTGRCFICNRQNASLFAPIVGT